MKKLTLGMFLAIALLASVAVAPAFAQDAATTTGAVQSVDALAGTFTMLTADGTTLTVSVPAGTDLSTLVVGTNVEVTGTLAEDGTLVATGIVIVPTDDDGVVDEPANSGFYCITPGSTQPALSAVAETYSADYDQVLGWFCDNGLGVGGVMLTLSTADTFGLTPEEILTMRETMGWGQIWKALEAAGNSDADDSVDAPDTDEDSPDDEDEAGDDSQGNSGGNSGQGNGNNGNGNGNSGQGNKGHGNSGHGNSGH